MPGVDPESSLSPTSPVATSAWLDLARRGDAAALHELCTRFGPRVRGLAAVRMGRTLVDLSDCDDIVQETLLTALQKLEQCTARSAGGFVCWLATIVESRLRNAHRDAHADKRGGGRLQRRADLGVTTLSNVAGAGSAPSPSQVLAATEMDSRLERTLLALGTPQRQIVYCRLVLDMSHAEIAAELGLASEDSARALFHKALVQLRARLLPEPGGE